MTQAICAYDTGGQEAPNESWAARSRGWVTVYDLMVLLLRRSFADSSMCSCDIKMRLACHTLHIHCGINYCAAHVISRKPSRGGMKTVVATHMLGMSMLAHQHKAFKPRVTPYWTSAPLRQDVSAAQSMYAALY